MDGDRMEQEANRFARALLMPESLLRIEYGKLHEDLTFVQKKKQIAKLFKVEYSLVEFRLVELSIIDFGFQYDK